MSTELNADKSFEILDGACYLKFSKYYNLSVLFILEKFVTFNAIVRVWLLANEALSRLIEVAIYITAVTINSI